MVEGRYIAQSARAQLGPRQKLALLAARARELAEGRGTSTGGRLRGLTGGETGPTELGSPRAAETASAAAADCIRRAVETARAQGGDAADGGDDRSMQVDGDDGGADGEPMQLASREGDGGGAAQLGGDGGSTGTRAKKNKRGKRSGKQAKMTRTEQRSRQRDA